MPKKSPTKEVSPRDFIHIKGARSNNLKNIELLIPKKQLVVVTGVSGSGKSSLIMDTLFAEGQRRYVESLSSYARQFLSRMKKPDVDFIKGISPAIAIEQKVSTSNARSTVGSLTEIYDYLRLLYARIGKTYSPITGKEVKRHTVTDVIDHLKKKKKGAKVVLLIPIQRKYDDRLLDAELQLLLQKGYSRIINAGEQQYIEDLLGTKDKRLKKAIKTLDLSDLFIIIDRFVISDEEENWKRIADSIQTAFDESHGECLLMDEKGKKTPFNNRFELDGIEFLTPTHQLFNYNNPYGACPKCEGYGKVLGIDPAKVVPNTSKSIYEGAVACWRGEKGSSWLNLLIMQAEELDFPIHKPYHDLSEEELDILWNGNDSFAGIHGYFDALGTKMYKIQNRIMIARYRGRTTCPECKGARLRKEAFYVKVDKTSIDVLINKPIDELKAFFAKIKLNKYDKQIAARILLEVNTRLETMLQVGLPYLDLNRVSSTLSGGETQRINLTRTLGSNLTNSLYILDEPSIGLHPKDTEKLVAVLKNLRDLSNTVIVIEHEEEVIRNADSILDIGPRAGSHGGEIVYNGTYKSFLTKAKSSLTHQYMTGKKKINLPERRRKVSNFIKLEGVRQHNLKNIDLKIPLNAFTVISGVSGSGKTTLVKHILMPGLKKELDEPFTVKLGELDAITGPFHMIKSVEMISQNPIGKSSRSNPVTYVKAYDGIRKLYSNQQLSKIRGFEPKHFSFNVDAGRCEKCSGEGEITVEMQFLADVKLLCEDCNGNRFKREVLEVKYNNKSIIDVLNMTIEDALEFFQDRREIYNKIKPLNDVGLGYVTLGQSASSLSGGEAQRVKLASYLGKDADSEGIFFIFDEPTTGLHFDDINKLLTALQSLVESGHTVVVIEHNMEVIKSADWSIDLGPEGGKKGGSLLYEGPPEGLAKCKKSFTGNYLKGKLV